MAGDPALGVAHFRSTIWSIASPSALQWGMLELMPTPDTCGPLDLDDALKLVEEVKRAASTGLPLNKLGDEADPVAADPKRGHLWARSRRIPAALIRQVLTDQNFVIDPRGLTLNGVCVVGELDLNYLHLICPLRLTSCYFENTLSANGIRALDLDLSGSCLPGLQVAGARLDGDLILNGITSYGQVNALCARIAGQFKLAEANLSVAASTGISLVLDSARIEGGAYFEGLKSLGTVRIAYADIAQQLDLEKSTLVRTDGEDDKDSLVFDGAHISGHVLLAGLCATGAVRSVGATITGQLDLNCIKIKDLRRKSDPEAGGFFAQSLKAESIILQKGVCIQGQFNLTRAEIGNLAVRACPDTGDLLAAGWRIKDIPKLDSEVERSLVQWLEQNSQVQHSGQSQKFVAQPWKEVADVFERNGRSSEARTLRVKTAHLVTRSAPCLQKLARLFYWALVGYGYRFWVAAVWLLAAIFVAAGATYDQKTNFVPANPAILAAGIAATSSTTTPPQGKILPATSASTEIREVNGATSCEVLKGAYPCFDVVGYSLATVMPPATGTEQTSAWRTTNSHLIYLFQALRIISWILIALLLGGLVTLLRKT